MADNQLYASAPSGGEVLADMIASLTGAFLQRALMAPSYRLTVLGAVEGELIRAGRLPPEGFNGVYNCLRRLCACEGPRALFRGLLTDAVLAVPSAVAEEISAACVARLTEVVVPAHFMQEMPAGVYVTLSLITTSAAVLLAAPVTAVHSTIVTNYVADIVGPIEVNNNNNNNNNNNVEDGKKNKKQGKETVEENHEEENNNEKEESYKYKSATETARDIRRRWGYRGFYRGVGLDAMAVFLYRGTYYYALQLLPSTVQENYPYAMARGLAIVAGCLTQPFEVLTRRMQLTASSTENPYNGIIDCARTIIAEEGYSGLWAGLRVRLLVTCVGMAVVELRRLI